jgi:hypothetical protein
MSRYKCAICERTRDEKFMENIDHQIKNLTNLETSHVCKKEVKAYEYSVCKEKLDLNLVKDTFKFIRKVEKFTNTEIVVPGQTIILKKNCSTRTNNYTEEKKIENTNQLKWTK